LGRAWCGHARPTATFAPAKFGAGKFCRFAQIEHPKIKNLTKSYEAKGEAGERTKNQKMSGGGN